MAAHNRFVTGAHERALALEAEYARVADEAGPGVFFLSAREAAIEIRKSKRSRLWDKKFTTENILDTLEAALTFAPSPQTIEAMEQSAGRS